MQVKKYSDAGKCCLENVPSNIAQDKRAKKIIENGTKTVADVFWAYDKSKYEQSKIFLEMLEFLNEYEIK